MLKGFVYGKTTLHILRQRLCGVWQGFNLTLIAGCRLVELFIESCMTC